MCTCSKAVYQRTVHVPTQCISVPVHVIDVATYIAINQMTHPILSKNSSLLPKWQSGIAFKVRKSKSTLSTKRQTTLKE